MAEAVYMLCVLTSAGCAAALLRTYSRRKSPILLWSSVCFAGLAANNALLFFDLVVFPTAVDLSMLRAAIAAIATVSLVVGLIWNVE